MKLQQRSRFAFVWTMVMAMLGAVTMGVSSAAVGLSMDAVQLGDAPRRDVPQDTSDWRELPKAKAAQAQTQARDSVAQLYKNVYVPGLAVALIWTGAVASCNAGTTNLVHRQAVIDRVNYFRTLVGLPPVTLLDGLPTTRVQAAALMMSANNSLSHTPPANWLCYSTDGANGAGSANIALGAYGVDAVDLYVDDPGANNAFAGHRRWILYPPQVTMATGDVSRTSIAKLEANALNVIGIFGTRPATPNGIAWPPAGFVPYQNLPANSNRWSFSYPGAGLTGAWVTMTGPAGPIPVTLEEVANGYGDNTLVFRPSAVSYGNPRVDTTYTINVSGMTGTNVPPSIQYAVTVIDPNVTSTPGLSLAVSSNANPSVFGQSVTLTATVTGNAATPTGTVTFRDGAGAIAGCSGKALDGTGHATCLSSSLASGSHSISIDYSGDAIYSAATSSGLIQVVNPTSQTIGPITSSPVTLIYSPGGTFALSATATSALTVTFTSQTPSVCSVSGSTAIMLAAGTCTIAANQAGNANYAPAAQRSQNFTITGVVPGTAVVNYQGLFWNAPAGSESGWGINFAHQGDVIFATWFTYDGTGRSLWLSMTANKTAEGVYAGTINQTRGPAFSAVPFSPAGVTVTAVGTGTLTFTDANNGSFAYSIFGISQTKAITRQVFAAVPTCIFGAQSDLALATNYQDLWWAAPAGVESGWGVNFTHQGDIIFATWFTYDVDGTPLWLSATATKTAPGVYAGTLNRTTGPAFNAVPFLSANVGLTPVGSLTLTFVNGNNATFAYTMALNGPASSVTQTKQVVRQVFRTPGTVCQ